MKKIISFIFASGFGVGYFPIASGTAGSFATLPFAFAAMYFGGFWALIGLALLMYVIGIFSVKEVLKYTKHDPSLVVIDEVVGQLLTFALVVNYVADWRIYLAGFLLFRLFDIVKPYPAGYFDRKVLNAQGVILDDVFAGVYAAIVLKGITCLF